MSTVSGTQAAQAEMMVHGSLMIGYALACMNLNIVAGRRATEMLEGIELQKWYPLSRWHSLERIVVQSYRNAPPIMLKVGIEMMTMWYHHGPGQSLVGSGSGFLRFQTEGGGFQSVVLGTADAVGEFKLLEFDAQRGRAVVYSTTPFNRDMERGVLIGGVMAPGDLDYVDVVSSDDPNRLVVEFH